VHPHVGVVVYDWRTWTIQELLRAVRRVLGSGGQVASLAVLAPGNKPGCVGEWGWGECVRSSFGV